MRKYLFIFLQYLIPQIALSRLIGWLADSRHPWIKSRFIQRFMRLYSINLKEAIIQNPDDYLSFNHFFTRQLKPDSRPIAKNPHTIISPVDGTIAEIGFIQNNLLLQVKRFSFDLESLLVDKEAAALFYDGAYTTLYLAPHNYHRVHMPIDGRLIRTIYIPGKLFSVNQTTAQYIPQLYSRNERLIALFETDLGQMAVIFVGALIVGSIQAVWQTHPIRSTHLKTETMTQPLDFKKGDELGCFKLGSTVILLFEANKIAWLSNKPIHSLIHFGEALGTCLSPAQTDLRIK